jgi:hypothetical protein
MKLTFMLVLLGCQMATAQSNFFTILRCKDRTYTNATIENITPATVDISWGSSGVRTSITNLPDKLQARYHYNRRKAQQYLAAQAAEKAAKDERANQDAAAVIAVENTLGPPQKIRVVKSLLFPGSIQIEVEGILSEASIPNLPPEILAFIAKFDQAQADAATLKQNALQARAEVDRVSGIAQAMGVYDPNFEQQSILANTARNNATEAERKSAESDAQLKKLQAQAADRATIIARPTGKLIATRVRQWQFQEMAAASPGQ